MNKKGMGIGDMHPAVLAIVLIGITLGIGLAVLEEFGEALTPAGAAANATDDVISALADFSGWLPIIVIVIAAAIILGLIMGAFGRRE